MPDGGSRPTLSGRRHVGSIKRQDLRESMVYASACDTVWTRAKRVMVTRRAASARHLRARAVGRHVAAPTKQLHTFAPNLPPDRPSNGRPQRRATKMILRACDWHARNARARSASRTVLHGPQTLQSPGARARARCRLDLVVYGSRAAAWGHRAGERGSSQASFLCLS